MLPMPGFKLRTPVFITDRSANWATTSAQKKLILAKSFILIRKISTWILRSPALWHFQVLLKNSIFKFQLWVDLSGFKVLPKTKVEQWITRNLSLHAGMHVTLEIRVASVIKVVTSVWCHCTLLTNFRSGLSHYIQIIIIPNIWEQIILAS